MTSDRSGRCVEHARLGFNALIDGTELLGHDLGYIWAVFYSHDKQRTQFALIMDKLRKKLPVRYVLLFGGERGGINTAT